MLETFIFHVLCSAGSDYSLRYRPILCDAVVLLQKEGIVHTTAALNSCHLPDNVLRLSTRHSMKQIVLTSCSVVTENDDNTSFLLPLVPTPDEFWLDEGPDLVEWDVQFDFSVAERMMEDTRIIRLLGQPFPVVMEPNEANEELLQEANVTDLKSNRSCEPQQARNLWTTHRSSHHEPVVKPGLATPSAFVSNDDDAKNQLPETKPIQHELSPLELYLQQEVAKNDRLMGFLAIVTIVLLIIFGSVGYRILATTTIDHHQSKADEFKKQWLAQQQVRRQSRLTVEKPLFLKPIVTPTTTTDPRAKLAPPKVASNRPESASPPRPIKSPSRLVATKSPPRVAVPLSLTKNAKVKSFEHELRSKIDRSCLTVNKNASGTNAVSWEDLNVPIVNRK